MIHINRRTVLAGGLAGMIAAPALAHPAGWRAAAGSTVLVYDPALNSGRRFAEAGSVGAGAVLALEGDRIRFARKLLASQPSLVAGISRGADALLIEDVAREAGYARTALFRTASGGCIALDCRRGWEALGRAMEASCGHWPEALASCAQQAGSPAGRAAPAAATGSDAGSALGWIIAPAR